MVYPGVESIGSVFARVERVRERRSNTQYLVGSCSEDSFNCSRRCVDLTVLDQTMMTTTTRRAGL